MGKVAHVKGASWCEVTEILKMEKVAHIINISRHEFACDLACRAGLILIAIRIHAVITIWICCHLALSRV